MLVMQSNQKPLTEVRLRISTSLKSLSSEGESSKEPMKNWVSTSNCKLTA